MLNHLCIAQAITREIYDDAIDELCKEEVITRIGDKVRLLKPIQATPHHADKENAAPTPAH